jgi:hypothetical protein
MPPKLHKLSSIPGADLSQDTKVWRQFCLYYESQRQRLRQIRDEENLDEADRAHFKQLHEYDDFEAWEAMFLQGYLRNPEATQTICEARNSFYRFIEPLPTAENELIDDLLIMKERLDQLLKKLNGERAEAYECHSAERIHHELKRAFEQVDSYTSQMRHSERARGLAHDIMEQISTIAQLAKKHSSSGT